MKLKSLFSLATALVLALSLCACTPSAPGQTDVQITNAGLTLSVPAKYRDLLLIELDSGSPQRKMHFRVSEKASVEAAKALWPDDETMGGGFLFGIGRVTEDEFRDMMCGEMAGAEVFAVDGNGNHYMYYHPTDVQLLRAGEYTDADWALWTELCEWAAGAPDRFMADNPGPTPLRRTNTSLDICLNRLLYWQNIPFTLTLSSTNAALSPSSELSLPYLEQLTACQVSYAPVETTAPEGEYITLHIPEENARFDFFLDDSGLFREFFFDGSSALYRMDCDSGTPGQIVSDWYNAAANTQ